MTDFLEVHGPGGPRLVPLTTEQVTIGRSEGNTVQPVHDPLVGRLHAVVVPVGGGWCVRDLGSRNGTHVHGERILGDRALRRGDEITVGRTRIVYWTDAPVTGSATEGALPSPELTRRERDVLVALCRPLLDGRTFPEPASTRRIAEDLVVSEDAVQQHLLRLYRKFRLDDDSARRRVLLANEAIQRGAVSIADLRP